MFRRYFRLDPHLDPLDDGANVVIVGLDSPTVLTLTPVAPAFAALAPPRATAECSWAPGEDVDCLVPARGAVHLRGPARDALTHAVRLGVSHRR